MNCSLQNTKEFNTRLAYADILRVIACVGVVCIHTANAYADFFVGAVSLFFAISGCVWLTKSDVVSIRLLWNKYILKLAIVFSFWSVVYDCYQNVFLPIYEGQVFEFKVFAINLLKGPFHFWYLWALLGIYVFMPLWQTLAHNRTLFTYVVVLLAVFTSIIPCLQVGILEWTTYMTDYVGWNTVSYLLFFLLGGWLAQIDEMTLKRLMSKRLHICLFFLSNAICPVIMKLQFPFGFRTLIEMIWIVSVIILIRWICIVKPGLFQKRWIEESSWLTLGVYCVHVLFVYIFRITLDLWVLNKDYMSVYLSDF